MCSRVLNGDAVVIFMRALCAVSQEELMPASPEEPARCVFAPSTTAQTLANKDMRLLLHGHLFLGSGHRRRDVL